eukprot:5734284-Prymnesium_polylepis.1
MKGHFCPVTRIQRKGERNCGRRVFCAVGALDGRAKDGQRARDEHRRGGVHDSSWRRRAAARGGQQ